MSKSRSIETEPPVVPRRLHDGRAVLNADVRNAWESRVVLNPAAVLVDGEAEWPPSWKLSSSEVERLRRAGGACAMLYRAQGTRTGKRGHAPSSLGFAVFTPGLDLVRRRTEPVIRPDEDFENLGVEDPRCTRVGDEYYLYYTGFSASDGKEPGVKVCLAVSSNLIEWEKRGPVAGHVNRYPNKNAALLPRTVNDKWLLLHRPMEGPDAMTIHWAESESPDGPWVSRGKLMESYVYREFSRSWIGAGGPPVWIGDDRFLAIYHQGHFTSDGQREYDLAAALLDFARTDPVVSRIEPLMRPMGAVEQRGDPDLGVDNVLFTCANYVWDNRLIIPYAGADSRIFGASIGVEELVHALEG